MISCLQSSQTVYHKSKHHANLNDRRNCGLRIVVSETSSVEVTVSTAASGSQSAKAKLAKTCKRSGPAIVLTESLSEPDNLQRSHIYPERAMRVLRALA